MEIRKYRKHAYHQIARYYHEAGYPKGTTFSIRGDSSFVLPVISWLYEYLGMGPVSVEFMAGEDTYSVSCLKDYLAANNISGSLERGLLLSGRIFISAMDYPEKTLNYPEGAGNLLRYITGRQVSCNSSKKAFLGGNGAMWIFEQIFSAVKSFPE